MLVETAEKFGCFPTDVLDAPAENMKYLKIIAMGTRPQKQREQEMEMEEEWPIQSQ